MKDFEILTLEKEFTDEHDIKHTMIYGNKFAYLFELNSINGKISFDVFNRLKSKKMPVFEKWNFKDDKEALKKFNSIRFDV